jgi:hypothetical protein
MYVLITAKNAVIKDAIHRKLLADWPEPGGGVREIVEMSCYLKPVKRWYNSGMRPLYE